MTKKIFLEVMEAIEKQSAHDKECAEAFSIILPNDYTTHYDNHYVMDILVKLLTICMKDNDKWIEYYIYELDCGRKANDYKVTFEGEPYILGSAEILWNFMQLINLQSIKDNIDIED